MIDRASLSYVAEPVKGVWVLGIDTVRYEENEPGGHPIVAGRMKPETLEWIAGVMAKARAQGKQVIPFMHHGLNVNFPPQDLLFGDYVVANHEALAPVLAGMGMKVIFTGHYHNIDAALPIDMATQELVASIWDVETPALGGYPAAYRVATVGPGGSMLIETERVTEIEGWSHPTMTFREWAKAWTAEKTVYAVIDRMVAQFPMLTEAEAAQLAPLVVQALMAQYDGDEEMDAQTAAMITGMMGLPEPYATLGMLLFGLWTDMPPDDNTVTIP